MRAEAAAAGEMGLEQGFESGEHVGCAVGGVAFDDGEGAVLRAEEADRLDDA